MPPGNLFRYGPGEADFPRGNPERNATCLAVRFINIDQRTKTRSGVIGSPWVLLRQGEFPVWFRAKHRDGPRVRNTTGGGFNRLGVNINANEPSL